MHLLPCAPSLGARVQDPDYNPHEDESDGDDDDDGDGDDDDDDDDDVSEGSGVRSGSVTVPSQPSTAIAQAEGQAGPSSTALVLHVAGQGSEQARICSQRAHAPHPRPSHSDAAFCHRFRSFSSPRRARFVAPLHPLHALVVITAMSSGGAHPARCPRVCTQGPESIELSADEQAAWRAMEASMAKMAGLRGPKALVRKLVTDRQYNKRYAGPSSRPTPNYNVVLYGNSGVGKTATAKLLYDVLKAMGILTGKFVAVTCKDMQEDVSGCFAEASDGMLFIDEAYGLIKSPATTREMLDHMPKEAHPKVGGNVMVVVAGYHKEMREWFDNCNQGLDNRFNHHLLIENYNREELIGIASLYLERFGAKLADDAAAEQLDLAAQYISSRPRSGNADHIHSVLDEAHSSFKGRCIQTGSRPGGCDCLTAEDIRAGLEALKSTILLQQVPRRMQPAHAHLAIGGGGGAGSSTDAHHVRLSPCAFETRARPLSCAHAMRRTRRGPSTPR